MELPDGAADGGPLACGALLGVLREVGLTGPRLALQVGSEEAVARQVTERAGVVFGEWATAFITDQVKAAMDSMELDLRLEGKAASPSIQSVQDAIYCAQKQKASSSAAEGSKPPERISVVIPKRGQMLKMAKPCRSMARLLEDEDEKIARLLFEELELVKAPVLEKFKMVRDPERARLSILGKYRASTAKRYLAYWQNFRRWAESMSNGPPRFGSQLVDYLHAREEEGIGASVPLAVSKAVSWFEKLACFEAEEQMSNDVLVQLVVRGMLKRLEDKTPPRKRAPRFLSCFMPALERLVTNRGEPERLRLGAWVKLVKVWASFRFDDIAHLRLDTVRYYDERLSGMMKRTKTTGAGKRVKDLPFHVGKEAWVDDSSWLRIGWEIARSAILKGGLLIPAGSSGPSVEDDVVMTYAEAVAWSTEVLGALKNEGGGALIPHGWERFWTEHSERSTLTSGLAALGVRKTDRDLLGRWTPEGSDQYVRTYNAVVGSLQAKFAGPIRERRGYTAYDEGSVLEELKDWLVEKWGIVPDTAESAVENWKKEIGPVPGGFQEMVESGGAPEEGRAQKVPESLEVSSSDSSSDEDSSSKRRKVDRLSEEREVGFVVVYNRIDRGKLHRGGPKGCWMARARKFRKATSYLEMPPEDSYTSRCRLCWPAREGSGSSSDSEDELIDDEPEEVVAAEQGSVAGSPPEAAFDAWT